MNDIVEGVLKIGKKGDGELRDFARSLQPGPDDTIVPSDIIRKYNLPEGAAVAGPCKTVRKRNVIADVNTVCCLAPDEFAKRPSYQSLIAIDPCERFDLSVTGDVSMRIIDLVAPIGKGTRGMIVSPPKAGKTMLLEKMTQSIRVGNPDTRIIVLLIDERPEEVTWFRRAVDAEVLASTSDQSIEEQTDLAELVLAHIRTELECGHDVVVFVDSLTRMGRAFNQKTPDRKTKNRIMSGGLGARAMEIPRRFFGLARNIENGGSVTIIATALVDTGSRMDQLIFEEFKGTGNSELVLDRTLADARIFPAINLLESGTRKEERLYGPDDITGITMLRRTLADRRPKEIMTYMLDLVNEYPTNKELLASLAKA